MHSSKLHELIFVFQISVLVSVFVEIFSRSPCLSPWASVDRPGYSPRGSTQDLGGKMFICSSSSSDEEPTIGQ